MKKVEAQTRTTVGEETRRALAENPELGAGNFLTFAVAVSPAADEPILWLERPYAPFFGFKGGAVQSLSLSSLAQAADAYAAWYHAAGVKPKDPVGVYLDDGVEYFVHFIALTRLGAIPVLTNGNMPPEIAAGHFRRVGAVGLFLDPSHRDAIAPHLAAHDYRFVVVDADLPRVAPSALPAVYPFRHAPGDPIMIAHSSGTTGIPKAVVLQHTPFFYGIRYRMRISSTGAAQRIVSTLPHSHNCAMAYIMLALLSGDHVYVTSDHTGKNLAEAIERFRPSMVVSFPETYVELTELDLAKRDLSSVQFWFNGGDAAHEQHIRALVAQGTHIEDGRQVKGAIFVDGMGSSEMGFSLFRNVHHLGTNGYERCVGKPLEWVEAAVLGENGELLPPGVVGRLGVRAPSVTSGYWNDSLLTHRTQVSGYWLTGDLAHRDEEGRFFHVDRVPDAIRTADGPVYSLATEEFLLKTFPGFADCTVVGAPKGDALAAVALVRLREPQRADAAATLAAINVALDKKCWPRIAAVVIADEGHIPLGTTGKVLKRALRERFKDFFAPAKAVRATEARASSAP